MGVYIKWAIGLALAGLIAYLLIHFVPGFRLYEKKEVVANDSLRVLSNRIDALIASHESDMAIINNATRTVELQTAKSASVVPNVTLQVKGLDQTAQLRSIVADLLSRKLDTTTPKRVESTAIALRIADTVEVQRDILQIGYAIQSEQGKLTRDTLTQHRAYEERGKVIASIRGWFTRRNRKLRDHVLNSPK